ncbi:acyl-CoA dehydrogenase family protein [Enterovirga rhinocerotis]|uniref:Alkylation response protein AidB-like acyl-CoA dehydrogenase n=1 Tax=Enterovirga rhinocerotis TaxID=1339210 RepID=A0A4R7BUV6_9HYPH|nr:acyl-CoA dehydrogenase family protein [Enterovirga rhinocerotis]TDR89281.1 alkylation response protein AidB-like acyl-CoA dehydrogenase [Enterovirga rhinocerotis]
MLTFPPPPETTSAIETLRREVRDFLAVELKDRKPMDRARTWTGFDADFSRKMGERGWIAMTWPKRYGGHERSALERYVVMEEMLAAGAPVAAHWISDRQSGPLLLKVGTEAQREAILPKIARGECFFAIGMSEPDSGSDLAATRTRATPVEGGFRVNGTKVWTTEAHQCHYMILFCRTGTQEDRKGGTSQFLVDLKTPGITIRPILDVAGEHHFNEIVLEDVFLPQSALVGKLGDGWDQVMGELAFERSGPERFLSSFVLLTELIRELGPDASDEAKAVIGRLTGHLMTLRYLSRSVAGLLQKGENPALHAAVVKDLGALYEQAMPDVVRQLVGIEPSLTSGNDLSEVLGYITLTAPSFSLRGGTREILRGIIARGLGLR